MPKYVGPSNAESTLLENLMGGRSCYKTEGGRWRVSIEGGRSWQISSRTVINCFHRVWIRFIDRRRQHLGIYITPMGRGAWIRK